MMNTKEIEKHLKDVFGDWVQIIPDKSVVNAIKTHGVVLGGCFASLYHNEPINDYDLFFTGQRAKNLVIKFFGDSLLHTHLVTPNAITLRANKIQIIGSICGPLPYLQKRIDFEHAKVYFNISTGRLEMTSARLNIIRDKQLVYTPNGNPIGAITRVVKYMSRGWQINNASLCKIVQDVQDEPKIKNLKEFMYARQGETKQ